MQTKSHNSNTIRFLVSFLCCKLTSLQCLHGFGVFLLIRPIAFFIFKNNRKKSSAVTDFFDLSKPE